MDVMLDLETLGKEAGCVILSIGAVEFDPATMQLGREYYDVISTVSCKSWGLKENEETLTWWRGQSAEAQKVLHLAETLHASTPLEAALNNFARWLLSFSHRKNIRIWGNGANFDQPILVAAYTAVGRDAPWEFWNDRCHRTLKALRPDIKINQVGTAHNALDDAKSQAIQAMHILRALHETGMGATSSVVSEMQRKHLEEVTTLAEEIARLKAMINPPQIYSAPY